MNVSTGEIRWGWTKSVAKWVPLISFRLIVEQGRSIGSRILQIQPSSSDLGTRHVFEVLSVQSVVQRMVGVTVIVRQISS